MQAREKRLLRIVVTVGGAAALIYGINLLLFSPMKEAEERIVQLKREKLRLEGVIASRFDLAERWLAAAARTFSLDRPEASNRFGQDLKEVAKRHGFDGAFFAPGVGTRIGLKTNVATVAYRIVAEGKYAKALALLQELYRTPYLTQITKLTATPIAQPGRARDEVKLEFTIETPILPPIDRKKVPELANVTTMPVDPQAPLGPARPDLRGEEAFAALATRNIFRAYKPPPPHLVIIDNQDWKTVVARVRFFWEDAPQQELIETVASKSQKTVEGKGDAVEVGGSYADGSSFGPEKMSLGEKKDWTYVVAVHSPPPPPTVVDLAVDNQDKLPIDIEMMVVDKDGKSKMKPTIRVKALTRSDIDAYEVASLTVTATYSSGKKSATSTFKPSKEKQVFTVPPEPVEAVVQGAPTSDPPPDERLAVTGLVTYRGRQEMIAHDGNQRKIIRAGEEGAVDGGSLLAVHPLGGVVKMPSGNFYLYPLGRKFKERMKLDASHEEELAAAIDACAGQ